MPLSFDILEVSFHRLIQRIEKSHTTLCSLEQLKFETIPISLLSNMHPLYCCATMGYIQLTWLTNCNKEKKHPYSHTLGTESFTANHIVLIVGILHQNFKLFPSFSLPYTMIEETLMYNLVFVL